MDDKQLELTSISIDGEYGGSRRPDEGSFRASHLQKGQYEEGNIREDEHQHRRNLPLGTLGAISCIGAGIQFGWALQLSLLTPYVETLGIPHEWASFIWLCGPISGLLVQPCIGVWSDTCTSRFGRRRPFILAGACLVVLAVLLIGFSADVGYYLGDRYHMDSETRPFACFVFILGFWCLDLSNNTVQGPSRALLSDLAGTNQMDQANAFYSLWLAVGNILGYSTGAIGSWYKWFPWLTGAACGEACGNLKAAFLLAIVFLSICTGITLFSAKETPIYKSGSGDLDEIALIRKRREEEEADENERRQTGNGLHANGHHRATNVEAPESEEKISDWAKKVTEKVVEGESREGLGGEGSLGEPKGGFLGTGPGAIVVNMLVGLRSLPPAMKSVLIVMAFSWMAWFPFLLFDTDWMGREIYHGDPVEGGGQSQVAGPHLAALYQAGVHEGALGLLLNSIIQAITSVLIDPLCRKFGSRSLWAVGNFIIFVCMASTYLVTVSAVKVEVVEGIRIISHPAWVASAAVAIFAILGAPLAITFSVPYALTADLTADSGGGQGLAMGILNLAIVLPQILVSLGAGPWDQLWGGGNEPAFGAAAIFALTAGIIALWRLPAPRHGYRPQHSTLAHGGF